MTPPFGPFSVKPEQIERLGASFAPFVNELLAVEVAAAGIEGSNLITTYKENIGDGGVDAGLRRATKTDWIPAGESAWQFKAGNLGPSACADELKGASGAVDVLRHGGKYRLVLGAALNHRTFNSRRKALIDQAHELGIDVADDALEVYDSNMLARWAEQHLALAVSPLLGGIDNVAQNFTRWSQSNRLQTIWSPSDSRDQLRQQISTLVGGSSPLDMRIEGVSGLGKTRAVLESMRGQPFEPLVVYVHAVDDLAPTLINQLLTQGRTAIVVIDECGSRRHEVLASLLPSDASVRLITIGEPDGNLVQSSVFRLAGLPSESIEDVLKNNQPSLWPEARRVVVEAANGNVRQALLLGAAVVRQPRTSASDLITADTIQSYVTQTLPDGSSFLACSALALFTRIGYERELSQELEALATLGFTVTELRSAAGALDRAGLLASQGRFRTVTPHPLAVYLATQAWKEFGHQIVHDLLPSLPTQMAERLLRRAADIGNYGPAQNAIRTVLSVDGPFGSLAEIAERGNGKLLTQIAIIAPEESAEHVCSLVEAAELSYLKELKDVRRDLVWTLEKLVWHSRTFESAASALLKLAMAENETWGNNATGTWIELFGVMLPGTAARPDARMAYLEHVSERGEPEARLLVSRAAVRALTGHERIAVSGELQGGVVVEPRGTPKTYGEVWEYQRAAIAILRRLVEDPKAEVSEAALNALTKVIHPLLDNPQVRPALVDALKTLPNALLRPVRTEIGHLAGIFGRVDGAERRQEGLDDLVAALPVADPVSQLQSLAQTRRWDLEDGELQARLLAVAQELGDSASSAFLALLESDIEAAYEVGHVLADIDADPLLVLPALAQYSEGKNSPAIVGHLRSKVERGNEAAFDEVLDGPIGASLTPEFRLSLSVSGPSTDRAWERVVELNSELPVGQSAGRLFGWHVDLDPARLIILLESWLPRLENQRDYNAAVDFTAMALYRREKYIPGLDEKVAELVSRRRDFPETGQQDWDWIQLAKRQLGRNPMGLLTTLVELMDVGAMNPYEGSEETGLLKEALGAVPDEGWGLVMGVIEGGSWRVQMDARGWLADVVPLETVAQWVGSNVERARLVASIADPGSAEPTPAARWLLTNFPSDERITSSLYGELITGSWMGNESDRLQGMIANLEKWVASPSESTGVKGWARKVAGSLRRQREAALEREAEEGI